MRGVVTWSRPSAAAGTTVELADAEGTASGKVVVRQFPDLDFVEGSRLSLTGLWQDRDHFLNAGPALRLTTQR